MKRKFTKALSLALILMMILTTGVLASSVDVAVVDVTAPTGSVTLYQGQSGPITINMSVTGKQEGTATFKVNTEWSLSGGGFIGSNPEIFTVNPRAARDPATTFSTSGNVSVALGQAVGTFTLKVSAFDITNSNATGGKLSDGTDSNYSITVVAAAPTNTAPSVVVTGVTNGEFYGKGAVPAAGCSVTDTEDGPSAFAATLSAITGPYAADGIGSQTASCSHTDTGGLTASASATYSIVDKTPPVISYILAPASPDGTNEWYISNVTLTWTVTELESPSSLSPTGCVDQTITADQVATTYSCEATSAGGTAGPVTVTIKRDATKPEISAALDKSPASSGWFDIATGAPTVEFTCSDATSGVAICPADHLFGEGADQSHSGTAFDNAGNYETDGITDVDIDLTAPIITWVGGPTDGGSYYFGFVPAAPTCEATDALSGPDGCGVTGYLNTLGLNTLTATAHDVAGNETVKTRSYTVLAWTLNGFYQPVDMDGVWNTVKGGSTVPLKFNIYAGTTELTNVSAVASFDVKGVACPYASAATDNIDLITTGGTTLRYDGVAGQFIQNWQTPKKSGVCYQVTMFTVDGSSIPALFKLK